MSLLLSLPLQSYSLRKSSSTWPRTSRGDFWYGRKPRTTIFTTACLGLYYCLVRPLLLPVLLLMSVHHTFTHVWSLYSAITVLRCIFTTQCNHCNYGVSLLHSAITVPLCIFTAQNNNWSLFDLMIVITSLVSLGPADAPFVKAMVCTREEGERGGRGREKEKAYRESHV